MTQSAELNALAVKVGEISGQLREVIHTTNNTAQKVDGLTEKLLAAPTATDLQLLAARVAALEAEKNRNDGAKGLVAAIMQSRFAAWTAAAAAVAFAAFKGDMLK